jgi:hypothetical protein
MPVSSSNASRAGRTQGESSARPRNKPDQRDRERFAGGDTIGGTGNVVVIEVP